ncbi:hypothetical protein G9A89_004870 [Geosiphon pyriformis]|nr:hypothetical protein G9A89_004870 [Geosiphon pyriformis]
MSAVQFHPDNEIPDLALAKDIDSVIEYQEIDLMSEKLSRNAVKERINEAMDVMESKGDQIVILIHIQRAKFSLTHSDIPPTTD